MQTYTTSESIHTTTIFFVVFQQFWRKKFVGPSTADGLAHIIYIKKNSDISILYLGTDDFYVFPPCSRLYNTNEKSWTEPSIVECAGWREIQNSIYWMGKVGSTCLMEYAFPFSSLESFVRAFLLFQHVVSQNFCPFKLICIALEFKIQNI